MYLDLFSVLGTYINTKLLIWAEIFILCSSCKQFQQNVFLSTWQYLYLAHPQYYSEYIKHLQSLG